MKKLFLCMALMAFLAGCQKASKVDEVAPKSATVATTTSGDKLKLDTLPKTNYYNSTYNAGPPVAYTGDFYGCHFAITSPVRNSSLYPTLVNGVPVFATIVSTANNCGIEYHDTDEGTVFVATLATVLNNGGAPGQFHNDIDNYFKAQTTWQKAGAQGVPPNIFDYVKGEYGTTGGTGGQGGTQNSSGPASYTGKIMRINDGSTIAIGSINYPVPSPPSGSTTSPNPPPNTNPVLLNVMDPNSNTAAYRLMGKNGVLYDGTTQTTSDNGASFQGPYNPVIVNGTYRFLGNGPIEIKGTVVRPDGSMFNLTTIVDQS